jgi:branched-chain amino acid transport system substrate-binding protein
MGMSKLRLLFVALIAGTALGVAGCGGDDNDGGGGGGGGGGDNGAPIKIGTSLPLTGDFSEPGEAAKQGYEVWQAITNENGGLLGRQVELVIKDDASNQNTVVADYNALISKDNVDLLLGTFSSLLTLPSSAVAEKAKMLYVEPAGGAPEVFERGYKFLFFTQQQVSENQGATFANWVTSLPEDQRPKTAAYPTLDDPFVGPTSAGIEKILTAGGIETVHRQTHTFDQKNFDTIANTLKEVDADLLVAGTDFQDGVSLIRSVLKVGYRPRMLYQTTAPSLGDQYAKGIGVENTEGVFYGVSHHADSDTEGNAEFVAKYKEMFGGDEVPEDAADAYAAAQVMTAAIEGVGKIEEDQTALADWLRENTVETVLGPLSWDDRGAPQGDTLTGQWQDGQPEIILPEQAATTDNIVQNWNPGG